MMLRSKLKNVVNVKNERQKRKQTSNEIRNSNEPNPKRSINDLSCGIKGFAIDSTKRLNRVNKENSNCDENYSELDEVVFVDPCPDYDYDKEEEDNPESISDYAQDIFKYYKHRESNFRVFNYFQKHPNIDIKTRAILVDWLVELQESFELNHETLYGSVKLVDLYLSKTNGMTKDSIQMLASAAIFLAAKYDERSPPLADDLVYLAGDRFNRDDLMRMERQLFSAIDFDLGAPLSYRYLRRISRVSRGCMESLTLARYILETSLLIYDYSLLAASRVACAAFLLAQKMKNSSFKWGPIQVKYSGYVENDILPLMEHLNHTLHFVNDKWDQLANIREKYSHEVFFQSALVPLLPDSYFNCKTIPPLPTMAFP